MGADEAGWRLAGTDADTQRAHAEFEVCPPRRLDRESFGFGQFGRLADPFDLGQIGNGLLLRH
jgi:hypothetical protein